MIFETELAGKFNHDKKQKELEIKGIIEVMREKDY
jgi:hypothetical protein